MTDTKDTKFTMNEDDTVQDDSSTASIQSMDSASGPKKKKGVSFGDVRVRTHKVVLGDNPSVSSGAPMTLAWDPIRSDRYALEALEELRSQSDHGSEGACRVSWKTRETWLRDNGHSSESFRTVMEEIKQIKLSRKATKKSSKNSSLEEDEEERRGVPRSCSDVCPRTPDLAPKMPCRRISVEMPLAQIEELRKMSAAQLKQKEKPPKPATRRMSPPLVFLSRFRSKSRKTSTM